MVGAGPGCVAGIFAVITDEQPEWVYVMLL